MLQSLRLIGVVVVSSCLSRFLSNYEFSGRDIALGAAVLASYPVGGWLGTAMAAGAFALRARQIAVIEPLRVGDYSVLRKGQFLRRIPEARWREVLQQMRGLRRPLNNQEIRALKLGQWEHAVFGRKYWLLFAFHAYLEQKITESEFIKLCLYDACKKYPFFKIIQLVDVSGRINLDAKRVLKSGTRVYLTDEQFELFIEQFARLPPEQTQFFCVPRQVNTDLALQNLLSIQTMREFMILDRKIQIVGNPEMYDQIYKMAYGMQAIGTLAVLGYSPKEKLSDTTQRVARIPCSLFDEPTVALHGYNSFMLTFYYHDMVYHHGIESANPHRAVWANFAKFVKTKGAPYEPLFRSLLDRDFVLYVGSSFFKETYLETAEEKFWGVLAREAALQHRSNSQRAVLHLFVSWTKEFFEVHKPQGISKESLTILCEKVKKAQQAAREPSYLDFYLDNGLPDYELHFLEQLNQAFGANKSAL